MSASELLEQVKALPPVERGELLDAIITLELGASPAGVGGQQTAPIVWPDVEDRARRTFGERVFPNPILLEREEADR